MCIDRPVKGVRETTCWSYEMLKHNYLFEDLSTVAPEPNPALDPTSSSGGMFFSLIYEIVSPGLAGKNQGVNLQK